MIYLQIYYLYRMKLKVRTFKDVLVHIALILGISVLLVITFFYIYLPTTTKHGETITTPSLLGKSESELDNFLRVRNLRYEIRIDSGYSEHDPPLTVLNQHPKPGSHVKENRKIYVTLNARKAPLVTMPNLINRKVANAERALRDMGLVRGEIVYEPDIAENAVLRQLYNGEEIIPGTQIYRGSRIDLVVGDGLGDVFPMHDLMGMELEEAKVYVLGLRMRIGSIIEDANAEPEQNGLVTRQNPTAGSNVRSGQLIDLWVGKSSEPSLPEY
jgi:eukaryotic-like serine/threonine-protein kinase